MLLEWITRWTLLSALVDMIRDDFCAQILQHFHAIPFGCLNETQVAEQTLARRYVDCNGEDLQRQVW